LLYVTYLGDADERFDRHYYVDHHLPLVKAQFVRYGLNAITALFPASDDATIVAVCVCEFDDKKSITNAFESSDAEPVMADVKNFTDIIPVRTISQPL